MPRADDRGRTTVRDDRLITSARFSTATSTLPAVDGRVVVVPDVAAPGMRRGRLAICGGEVAERAAVGVVAGGVGAARAEPRSPASLGLGGLAAGEPVVRDLARG